MARRNKNDHTDPRNWKYTPPNSWKRKLNPFYRKNMYQPTRAENILQFIIHFFYALTFPFWLVQMIVLKFIKMVKATPAFIKSIPTMPKRLWYSIIFKIKEILWDQSFLRRASWKWKFQNLLKFLIFSYFMLSLVDEMVTYFAPTTYWYLKFLTENSFLVFFSTGVLVILVWIISFYFVNIYFIFKSKEIVYMYVLLSFMAIQLPALLFLWFYAICENFEILLSIYFIFYCFLVNEQTEEFTSNEGILMRHYSWQTEHYKYKVFLSKNEAEKKIFESEVQRWKKYDKSKNLLSAW